MRLGQRMSEYIDDGASSDCAEQEVLGAVYRRQAHAYAPVSADISDAAREESDSVEAFCRMESFRRMLGFVFSEGPDPACAMQRLYALARSYAPDQVMALRAEDIAMIFGVTPEAKRWRRLRIVPKSAARATALQTPPPPEAA
jgi:hypothetical protein